MAAEAEAFPVTQYRHIKACILHSMELRLSAIAPKPEVYSRMSMTNIGTDNSLHIPPVAMSTALMAAEGEAFPVTQYRLIKACILHFQGVATFGDYAEAGSK